MFGERLPISYCDIRSPADRVGIVSKIIELGQIRLESGGWGGWVDISQQLSQSFRTLLTELLVLRYVRLIRGRRYIRGLTDWLIRPFLLLICGRGVTI